MEMNDDRLMSVAEFNSHVRLWGAKVRTLASGTLVQGTHSTGDLLHSLRDFEDPRSRSSLNALSDPDSSEKPVSRVRFSFSRHGVFRAYGAGRGYVVRNGQVVHGARILDKHGHFINDAVRQATEGYRRSVLRDMRLEYHDRGDVKRTPLDWLDHHLDNQFEQLADLAHQFYGDQALKALTKNFDRIKIDKHGK